MMLKGIQMSLKNFLEKHTKPSSKKRLPRAVPSVEEAILPFNPADYAIQPRALKRMIDGEKPFVLLDVRDECEYETAHLSQAIWISLSDLPRRLSELNPYAEIIVYCHHGMRSLDAACLLQQFGFKHVKSLVGGINRWAAEIDPDVEQY